MFPIHTTHTTYSSILFPENIPLLLLTFYQGNLGTLRHFAIDNEQSSGSTWQHLRASKETPISPLRSQGVYFQESEPDKMHTEPDATVPNERAFSS